MATDGPTPTACDDEVFRKGEVVSVTHSIPSNAMEGWVKKIAITSGQPVDWHFAGGLAIVKALGDIAKVKQAIVAHTREHDELYRKAIGSDLAMTYSPPVLV